MKRGVIIIGYLAMLIIPSISWSIETAPRISDREIIERLTRLEEGQHTLQAAIKANAEAIKQLRADMKTQSKELRNDMKTQITQLRADMNAQNKQLRADMKTQITQLRSDMKTQINQLRADMKTQIMQLRADMNSQFNRLAAIFTALVVAIIGFALWDRRTMIRPFETRMSQLEGEVIGTKERLGTLIESLRSLSKGDEKLAEILKRFNLL
jgi:exonuclease VII large subunit